MPVAIDDLAQRLTVLEDRVGELTRFVERLAEETPAERGARLLREARMSQAQLTAGWLRALEQMGIRGEPIPVEKLREMMLADGIRPEDNEFSRGIIEMREE